jgi:para-nitrobenzyl esterase
LFFNLSANIFGFSEIGGERFARSGNAGVLDLVASLESVRDNVARFGRDPANVTIFGQSGGGGKVSAVLAMPAAKGLLHRAIVMSGAGIRMAAKEHSAKIAEAGAGADRTEAERTRQTAAAAGEAVAGRDAGRDRTGAEEGRPPAAPAARPLWILGRSSGA